MLVYANSTVVTLLYQQFYTASKKQGFTELTPFSFVTLEALLTTATVLMQQ